MWHSRRTRDDQTVTCIACGATLPRRDAREYDKYGDRWDRTGKRFEYLCKPCHREQCHQPRNDLEALLVEIDAGGVTREEFFRGFDARSKERSDHVEK